MPIYGVESKIGVGRVVLVGKLGVEASGIDFNAEYECDLVGIEESSGRRAWVSGNEVNLIPFVGHRIVDKNSFGRAETIEGESINRSPLRGRLRFSKEDQPQEKLIILGFLTPFK